MKDEIVAGIRNALARGQTLEQAAKSFVSAGYNPQEVNAAYQELLNSAGNLTGNSGMQNKQMQFSEKNLPAVPVNPLPKDLKPVKKENSSAGILITLIIISMLILLGAIGYFFYAFYIAK